jgi:hypothetical protein
MEQTDGKLGIYCLREPTEECQKLMNHLHSVFQFYCVAGWVVSVRVRRARC